MARQRTGEIDESSGQLPLGGVKAIEFCQVAAGPFCGMLLSDFGADVTKIEPPGGDSLRQWPPLTDGYSENFASLNRGKHAVVLNLKDPFDRDRAREMVLDADVLVENSRPGVMQRLGLGWDWFSSRKPGLIYCSISAYGQTGPRSTEGGFDVTLQAMAGVMSVTGEAGGAPVKCGVPIADFTAGLYAAFTIASLLSRVREGGRGGHIDVPMMGTTLAVGALQTSEFFGTGSNPRKLGSAHPRNAPYQAFKARDDWFVIAAGNNGLWTLVCKIVEAPELLADSRFLTPASRAANQSALKVLLEEKFAARDAAQWLALFEKEGVPSAPINQYDQALQDHQTLHLQLVQPLRLPSGRMTRTVASPIWIDGVPVPLKATLPPLGQHASRVAPD